MGMRKVMSGSLMVLDFIEIHSGFKESIIILILQFKRIFPLAKSKIMSIRQSENSRFFGAEIRAILSYLGENLMGT